MFDGWTYRKMVFNLRSRGTRVNYSNGDACQLDYAGIATQGRCEDLFAARHVIRSMPVEK